MSNKITLHETADGNIFDSKEKADKAERTVMLLHDMEVKQEVLDVNLLFYIGTMEALEPSLENLDYIPNLLDGYRRLYDKYFGPHAISQESVSNTLAKITKEEKDTLAANAAAKKAKKIAWDNQSTMLVELYGEDTGPLIDDM